MPLSHRNSTPLDTSKAQSAQTRKTHSGKVPIICELHERPGLLGALPRAKYLVSNDTAGGSLREAIRSDMTLTRDSALHLHLDANVELDYAASLGRVDSEHRDEDASGSAHGEPGS